MKKTVILLGASGLTGSILLKRLITDTNIEIIILFSRNKTSHKSNKIREYILDFKDFHEYEDKFKADIVFCCIGTTKNKTKDKKTYKNIDCGIPTMAANLAKKNNIDIFLTISALGANSNSMFFYNKTKGEMEDNIISNNIRHTYILRPSLIVGKREDKRFMETLTIKVLKVATPFLRGKFKKYNSIDASAIARALHIISDILPEKQIILSDEIQEISDNNNKV